MTPSSTRRERERAERHQLIIDAARDLAEAEGWDAVTTRRLAAIVEYSQPVLYSHFDGKDAIVRAVALQGFADLGGGLRHARSLRAVCLSYLEFAVTRPALYQAMFVMPTDVKFASQQTPPELRSAFDEFVAALPPGAPHRELTAEVIWSALHGFATLAATGRIPPGGQDQRVDVLLSGIALRVRARALQAPPRHAPSRFARSSGTLLTP